MRKISQKAGIASYLPYNFVFRSLTRGHGWVTP